MSAGGSAPALLLVAFIAACSSSDDDRDSLGASTNERPTEDTAADATGGEGGTTDDRSDMEARGMQQHPDVLDVTVEGGGGIYDFSVTISSPYDTPNRYADGWRVMDDSGTVYGEHQLMHDHADEQPFTRTQTDVEIPEGVTEVIVEGRDLTNGYGGETATVALPAR